jgi:hypothetical protein
MHIKAASPTALIIVAGLLAFYTSQASACDTLSCKLMSFAQGSDQSAQSDPVAASESAPDASDADMTKNVMKNARRARKSPRIDKSGNKLTAKSSTSDKTIDSEQPAARSNDLSNSGKMGVSASVANANAFMTEAAKNADDLAKSFSQSGIPAERLTATDSTQNVGPSGQPPANANVQIVASDQFNELDRAAPEQLMMAQLSDSDLQFADSTNAGSDSNWAQLSLIGKILVGLGAVLTLASATRMLRA